ncbi:MAG: integrase domain-containing protein, partial [Planctomycetes bacterium]|nr:integrase domain-containing protein [Planctomycetota bacterium]
MIAHGPLVDQLVSLMGRNREGSYATQRKRFFELRAIACDLKERFGLQKWDNLRQKHVRHLMTRWTESGLQTRSVEQKLSLFRWLLAKIGKPNLLPRSNAELGIEPGRRYTRQGNIISNEQFSEVFSKLADPRIRAMLLLARYLGLRFEEAALFRPGMDWQVDRVWIKRGTKGGHARYLYLYNEHQREVLEFVHGLSSGDRGMIPPEVPTFEKWRQYVYDKLRAAGMSRQDGVVFHDCRRRYA